MGSVCAMARLPATPTPNATPNPTPNLATPHKVRVRGVEVGELDGDQVVHHLARGLRAPREQRLTHEQHARLQQG